MRLNMTFEEKVLLLECLLRDIRLNWAELTKRRINLAKKLCKDIANDESTPEEMKEKFSILYDSCVDAGRDIEHEDFDGRFFREEFPYGYEEMDKVHNIPHPYKLADRSDEFKKLCKEFLTCPGSIFEDAEYDSEADDDASDRLTKLISTIDLSKLPLPKHAIIRLIKLYCDCKECPCPKEVPCVYHTIGRYLLCDDVEDNITVDDVHKYNTCEDALYLYLTRKEEENKE